MSVVFIQNNLNASGGGFLDLNAALAASETHDAAALTAAAVVSGVLAATEAQDGAALTAAAIVSGDLSATEAQDGAAFTSAAVVSGLLAATETPDGAALSAYVVVERNAALDATEAQDGASFSAAGATPQNIYLSGNACLTWAMPKRTAIARLFAVEPQDAAAFTVRVLPTIASLQAIEATDRSGFSAEFDDTDEALVLSLMAAAWDRAYAENAA